MCLKCGGDAVKRVSTFSIPQTGLSVRNEVENVPSWECTSCGRVFYDGDTVDALFKAKNYPDYRKVELRVFNFNSVMYHQN